MPWREARKARERLKQHTLEGAVADVDLVVAPLASSAVAIVLHPRQKLSLQNTLPRTIMLSLFRDVALAGSGPEPYPHASEHGLIRLGQILLGGTITSPWGDATERHLKPRGPLPFRIAKAGAARGTSGELRLAIHFGA